MEAEPEFGAEGRGIVPGDQAVQEKGRKEGRKENNDKITPRLRHRAVCPELSGS